MKNYIIGLLGVTVLFLGSIVYKEQNAMVYHRFPIPDSLKTKSTNVPFYLFLFFTKDDCMSCQMEILEVLNRLPSQYCTAGIVPVEELKNESKLRQLTRASFPLYSFKEYKKYLPCHTPTLYGVSPLGEIIFVFPGILGHSSNLKSTLDSIYMKFYPSFEKKYISMYYGNKK